ncbi:MAG: hypothetical protein RR825_08490, partial [Ruthenibacterium sp.]
RETRIARRASADTRANRAGALRHKIACEIRGEIHRKTSVNYGLCAKKRNLRHKGAYTQQDCAARGAKHCGLA